MSTEAAVVSLVILGSSFWGSWHCAAMCGPLATLAAKKNSLIGYHLGRGLGYVVLGVAGGFLGSFFLSSDFLIVRNVAGVVFASLLVIVGIQTWRGNGAWRAPQAPFFHKLFNYSQSGFAMGLLTIFLPCGWLYSYVLAAAATRSPWAGAYLMLLFWIAGLPALSALSLFMKKSIQGAPERKRIIAGVVLIAAGLYSLFSFYFLSSHYH